MAIGAILHYIDDRPDLGKDDAFALICLADWANDRGECFPSMATVAKRLRISTTRGAQKAVARLCANGELLVVHGAGAQTRSGPTNLYVLVSYRQKMGVEIPAEWLGGELQDTPTGELQDTPTGELQDTPTGELQDTPTGELQDTPTGELQDTQNLSLEPVIRSSQIDPDLDRQTDRDPAPSSVCLSVDDHAQARREIIQAFQAGGVFLPATADAAIDAWIAAYPAPAIRWAIQDALAKRDAGKKIGSWSSYISAVLENRQAEGWPPAVLDDLRRGGYALEAAQADPTAGEFPQPDPVDLGHADHAPDLIQPDPDPGSDLDQAWAAALDDLRDRLSPVFLAALASCRLVGLNGRATVRAHDAMAEQAVTRTARQLEVVLDVAGIDLAA